MGVCGGGDHVWEGGRERGGVEADFAEEFLFEEACEGRGGVRLGMGILWVRLGLRLGLILGLLCG